METQLITIVLTGICLTAFLLIVKRGLALSSYSESQQRQKFVWIMVGVGLWTIYSGLLAYLGILQDFTSLPPKAFVFVIFPPFLTICYLIFSGKCDRLLRGIEGQLLIYLQSFRVLVEILLWLMCKQGLIPIQMTFEGQNWDILTGITAPFIAYWFCRDSQWKHRIVYAWNFFGLALLANIVTVAILSMPLPFRVFMNEPANTAVTHFPYVFIPSVFVVLAYTLHFMSLRKNKIERK